MTWRSRIVQALIVCSAVIAYAAGQESPPKAKARVELRWVETKPINGVTEDKGYQKSCEPKDIVYPHREAALVLTSADVSDVCLTRYDFSREGVGVQYTVTFRLRKESREKLDATIEGHGTRLLTVVVDGKYWGVHPYEKGGDEKQTRSKSFVLYVGFFPSEAKASRFVDALE